MTSHQYIQKFIISFFHFYPLNNKIYVYYNTKESAFRSLYRSVSPALKIISLNAPFTRLRLSGLIFLLLISCLPCLLYKGFLDLDAAPTRHSPLGCYESEHLRLSHHHSVHKQLGCLHPWGRTNVTRCQTNHPV